MLSEFSIIVNAAGRGKIRLLAKHVSFNEFTNIFEIHGKGGNCIVIERTPIGEWKIIEGPSIIENTVKHSVFGSVTFGLYDYLRTTPYWSDHPFNNRRPIHKAP